MTQVQNIIVTKDDSGQRLDRWLGKMGVPFFLVHKFCRSGQLRIDGKRSKADVRLQEGQKVRVPPYTPKDSSIRTEERPLTEQDRDYIQSLVMYDDGKIIALNKPNGLATQGGTNMKQHVDRMLEGLCSKGGVKPRLVHRLDKDTSGILLLARSAEMARLLGESFKSKDIEKYYIGITTPVPDSPRGEIKVPLLKKSMGYDKDRIIVSEDGRFAHTLYKQLEKMGKTAALLVFKPLTGRTHQIRVHSAFIGCPLIGDFKYGYEPEEMQQIRLNKRLHLHAYRLKLPYPGEPKKTLELIAPLPDDFKENMASLGFSTQIRAEDLEF
jgi:23S rRNA pseudouridine955/2504/2580 synthase